MKEKLAFFHVFIFIHMVQVGLILFRFPQIEAEYFGTNGWASLLICFAAACVNILLSMPIFAAGKGRMIFEIMEQSAPKFMLYPFYLCLIVVWGMLASLTAKEYVHILKMVSFPTVSTMVLVAAIGLVSYYLLSKGIYNIAKAATVFFLLFTWLILLMIYFHQQFQWMRLTPFLFQDSHDMGVGILNVYPAFLGYELTLLLIPYSDRRTKLVKAAYWSTCFAAAEYLFIGIVCFGVFSLTQLKKSLFPVLDLLAYIKFPFMERIENLFYGFFLFSNIISIVAYYWSASQVAGQIMPKLNAKLTGILIIALCAGTSMIPGSLMDTEAWLRKAGYAGIAVAFGLPVILIGFLLVQKGKGGSSA